MNRAAINFTIARWRAWAPGLETPAAWSAWSVAPWIPTAGNREPDVAFLSAMQRRRLSHMARMAFNVAWPLAEGLTQLPLVFVSRHGETPRTFGLLSELATRQALSPTQFSLSVHNAVIGLWSILRRETSEMTALAASGDGLEHGMLEAAAMLAEGAPAVLLVITEEQPPDAYLQWIDDVPFPYALALLLTPGNEWGLSLETTGQTTTASQWPHPLKLVRALSDSCCVFQHTWKNRTWTWQRNP